MIPIMPALWSRARTWLRALTGRARLEHRIDEELQFHLDARAADLIRQGIDPRAARRTATLEFGAVAAHKDQIRHALGLRWFDDLVADLRYAARLLRKSPGFTAIAVTSLALAIGANTTIFSLANEMLYRRLAIPRAQELRVLTLRGPSPLIVHSSWGNNYDENGVSTLDMFTYPIYRQLQAGNRTLGSIVAFKNLYRINLTAGGEAQSAQAQLVSGNFYTTLEVRPQLGRSILPADDTSAANAVALIGDSLWRRAFNASPAVLGRTLNVNGALVTVIGVNPPGFTGVDSAQVPPDIVLPLSLVNTVYQAFGHEDPLTSPNLFWVNLIARARPGVSPDLAAANLNAVFRAAVQGTMKIKADDHIPTVLVADGSRGLNEYARWYTQPVHVLLGLTGLVLLLACANIANLMLARATAREREMTVRLALGAGRSRVLRQVLTESLLLSTLGGLFGLLLGYLGHSALPALISPAWLGNQFHIQFDWHVFAFTSALTIVTGLLFGLLPAWRSSRGDVAPSLKETGRSTSRRSRAWTGKFIVAFQVALSTLLVAASALFLRTLLNLNQVQPGFRTAGLLQFDIAPPAKRYPGHRSIEIMQQIEQALAAVPGVEAVTFANPALLANSQWNNDFNVEGLPKPASSEQVSDPYLANVGEQFLPVMQIRLLRGRNFGPGDTATSPRVSIINQSIARKYFPTLDPIGRRFSTSGGFDGKTKVFYTVIGVCADTLYSKVRQPPQLIHFELYIQGDDTPGGTLILRTGARPADLLPTLRRVVQRIDPDLPLTNIRTMQQQIDADLQQERMFATLTSAFGLLALLLACVGIYGIMAYTVTQRTNEIGIRLALGAQRAQVRGMVLREGARLALLGVVVGLTLVLALVRLVQTMLYGLKPRDPVSLAATCILLLGVALLSCWLPAARAARVEPMEALRHE